MADEDLSCIDYETPIAKSAFSSHKEDHENSGSRQLQNGQLKTKYKEEDANTLMELAKKRTSVMTGSNNSNFGSSCNGGCPYRVYHEPQMIMLFIEIVLNICTLCASSFF